MIDEKNIDVDWQETRRFLEEKYFSKIRELSKKYDYPCENIAIDFNWVFGLIEKIEQQPKTDWIPCEERLPECEWGSETKALMFQIKNSDYIEVGYYGEGGKYRDRYFRTYTDTLEGFDASDVIAWQPLPQPYKKEGAE